MNAVNHTAVRERPDQIGGSPGHTALQELQSQCEAQETRLNHAAENIDTRGIKLLIKAYAHQRATFARQLAEARQPGDVPETGESLERGMGDVMAAMTLGRENRRVVALDGVIEHERTLLQAYTQALQLDFPGAVRDLLERQRNQVAAGYDRLVELSREGASEPVTRVYAHARQADEAVASLQRAGFGPAAYEVFDVENLPVQQAKPQKARRSAASSAWGGAIGGGVVGGLMGAAYAIYQALLPNMALHVSVHPLVIFLAALLFGAFWGGVFGWIIGRNKVETDQYLLEDSIENGTRLVVVYATPENSDAAHRILGVYHDRELAKE